MDSFILSTAISTATLLGSEVLKGTAGNVGEDLWAKIKTTLGMKSDPKLDDLRQAVSDCVAGSEETAVLLLQLLREKASVQKVVMSHVIRVQGDFNM